MNFIKENLITIILVILIIIIVLCISLFSWKMIQSGNVNVAENNKTVNNNLIQNTLNKNYEKTENIEINNNYIDISKYYLDMNNGEVAKIYNNMLDKLVKQKCIIETSNGSDCKKIILDLNKMCFLTEYDEFYECWAHINGSIKKYKYNYSTKEVEASSEVAWWMRNYADFIGFAIDFQINNEDYKWDYQYNKNVLRNGYLCYEIIANWDEKNNDYNRKSYRFYGTDKLYIDMETYKLIEIENLFYIDDKKYIYSNFYEYSDDNLEIPKEAENYIYNYN